MSFVALVTSTALAQGGDSTWRDHDAAARMARERRDWPAALRHSVILDSLLYGHPRITLVVARAQANLHDTAGALATLHRYARMGLTIDVAADSQLRWLGTLPAFVPIRERMSSNLKPKGSLRVAATMHPTDFIGEGVAYDARGRRLLASSIRYGTVVAVDEKGASRDFIDLRKDGGWSGLGLAIDVPRDRLWVTTKWYPHTAGVSPADSNRSSVFLYQLSSGKHLERYDLPRGNHEPGDLCVGGNGDVYVSDGRQGTVSVIRDGRDSLAVLVPPGQLITTQGCAVTERGGRTRVLVADYGIGVASVDVATGQVSMMPHSSFAAVTAIDGMTLDGDRLIGVQNGVDPHRVIVMHLDADHEAISSVSVVAQDTSRIHEPTHVTMMDGDIVFVANGGFGAFDQRTGQPLPGARLHPMILARVSLSGATPGSMDTALVQRELLALDRSIARSSVASPAALLGRAVDAAPILVPMQPILQAGSAKAAFESRYASPAAYTWAPWHAVASSDGLFGCTTGGSTYRKDGSSAPRAGSYITCWQRASTSAPWQVVAHQRNEDQGDSTAIAARPARFPRSATGPRDLVGAEESLMADEAFARRAALPAGPQPAFAAFAADDGMLVFPPVFPVGPAAIARQFEGYPPHRVMLWHPDRAYGGGSGGLAYTVGYSLTRDRGTAPGREVAGKYFSVWRRSPVGRWEWILDQGTSH